MFELPQNCHIVITQDGSPTLQWLRADGYGEKMHHSGGALSESVFIYHHALCTVLDQGWHARVLSLGLGLAYNELLTIAEFERRNLKIWKLWSFESEDFLRLGFQAWLDGQASQIGAVFDQVAAQVAGKFGLDSQTLRALAAKALREGNLELREAFPADRAQVHDCSCVFYDAFSKKMAPELWIEDEIKSTFTEICSPRCVVATYAATGSLFRPLKSLGFRLLERQGFMGKRESTLAMRE